MPPPPADRLDRLRTRARQFQLAMGLGFLSMVLGSALSVGLGLWLPPSQGPVGVAVIFLLGRLWALAVLPLFLFCLSQVVELRPAFTAAVAVATGEVFLLGVQAVTGTLGSPVQLAFDGGLVLVGAGFALGAARHGRRLLEARAARALARSGAQREKREAALRTEDRR